MRKLIGLLVVFLVFENVHAQMNNEKITFEQYLQIVKAHHPFMQRAELIPQHAAANLLAARGEFDPKVFADVSQKYFSGDKYYSYISTGVSVPTWFGLSFYSGYDQTEGSYINPQFRTPEAGLVYAGAQLTLGQGLLIDKRRADLRKAQLFTQIAEQDRVMFVNQLLLDASLAYWDWYAAYKIKVFIDEAYNVTKTRFEAIKQAALFGERALIDTLEMSVQLQNLNMLQQDFSLQEQLRRLECGYFLWADGLVPVELKENVEPGEINASSLTLTLSSIMLQLDDLVQNHPELLRDMVRIDQQQIDLRLQREMLKPMFNLKYNAINQPIANNPMANYSLQNYTWGLDFSIPVLLRNERAQVQMAKLRLQDMSLLLDNKRALLVMKAKSAINEWQITEQQLSFYTNTVQDIQRLLQAERTRFDNGESSVFLVNTREMTLVNAQIKLFEVEAKNQKAIYKALYSLALMEGV
jgi:outer membrane protein TolC